jgi:thioredoxin reductase (NADPH)
MAHTDAQDLWDCLIVGGGPAGLTAAIYLARYQRKVLVIDAGNSRAAQIPETHNHPGYKGISGRALLARLGSQARQFGAVMSQDDVTLLQGKQDAFEALGSVGQYLARRVLMATGLTDRAPQFPGLAEAVADAQIRYCPICDGYEVMDQNIAVLGDGETVLQKARFLRTYSRRVTILPSRLSAAEPAHEPGITVTSDTPQRFERTADGIVVELTKGQRLTFEALYPALGCQVHSDLATRLGATAGDQGCLIVDSHQQTSVRGLYAAGDVVSDLHQIVVAEGHAAIAATAIHNSLPRNVR